MNKIIAVAVALAFSSVSLVQAQTTMEKVEKAGAENTKATNKAKAKKKADDEARSKANKEARDKNKGAAPDVPASVKKTHDGMEKKRMENKDAPAPKR